MVVNFAPLIGFQSRKAAQVAAYFVSLEEAIEKLKLIKLIYLSEREFLSRYSHPMLFDELYSLEHGPICSSTLNGINGEVDEEEWSQFIELKNNRNVIPVTNIRREALDEVSDAEMDVLDFVWKKFGKMSASEIRRWTHKNCPEYTEIEKGRLPISYLDLFEALGEKNAEELDQRIRQIRRADSIFTR